MGQVVEIKLTDEKRQQLRSIVRRLAEQPKAGRKDHAVSAR
jgi:hypothetical protein